MPIHSWKWRRGPSSRRNGGAFGAPPDRSPRISPAFWHPAALPALLAFAPAAADADAAPGLARLDPATIVARFDEASHHQLIVEIDGARHRLRVPRGIAADQLALSIALDGHAPIRFEAAIRFERSFHRRPIPAATRWGLTRQRRDRLAAALAALDILAVPGARQREVAALLDPDALALSASAFKGSDIRPRAQRLIRYARGLLSGGYRLLLAGG